jgi:cytochrome c oxidase subunit 2
MDGGEAVVADEGYFRESVLNPRARLVAGYQSIMPTFQGQVSEDQLLQLLAYVRSQKPAERTATD